MNLQSFLFILHITLGFVHSASFGSRDCNTLAFLENIERLCHTYYGFAVDLGTTNYLKRETEAGEDSEANQDNSKRHSPAFQGFGTESFHRFLQQGLEAQNLPLVQPYPWQLPPRSVHPATPQHPDFFEDQRRESHHHHHHQPQSYIEPQDFETFNFWYLNPVYSEVDLKGGNERWKRNGFKEFMQWVKKAQFPGRLLTELWNFFHSECCGDGCRYPEEYARLDQRINFCNMH